MNKITQWCKALSWPIIPCRYSSDLEIFHNGVWSNYESHTEKKSLKPRVCILQKQHYFETTRTYPIKNWIHLVKVVRAEAKTVSPYGTASLWAVTGFDAESGVYVVTYWSLSQQVAALVNKFTFFVPETLLLKSALTADVIYRVEAEQPLYFYHNEMAGIKSMQEDALVPTAPRFAELIHCSTNHNTEALTYTEYQKVLIQALLSLPPWFMCGLSLAKTQTRDFDFNVYKWPAVISGVLVLSYAAGVSSYQYSQLESIRTEIASKQKKAIEIVNIESKIDEQLVQWNTFTSYKNDYPGVTKSLNVLVDALSNSEATLTNYRLQGNDLTIYCLAPSATKAFEEVVALPSVSNVKLSGNVSVDRRTKKERFIISMKIKGSHDES